MQGNKQLMEAHSVCDKVANTREYLSRNDDSVNNGTQSLLCEDDVSGGHGSISCPRNRNTDVGML
mgnify:CR=1 FL=1